MSKLLYIESSPRKDRSKSIAVANAFLDAYRVANPDDEIAIWDLWSSPLPEFDGDVLNAKYQILHGQTHTPAQVAAWQAVVDVFTRFDSADKYLISVPMWNFGIPYKLKHLIDVIAQPGLTFSFSPETGYTGLVTGKPVTVVYARGGEYSSSDQMMSLDFQKPYLDHILGFFGFTDIHNVLVEPTLADPGSVANTETAAAQKAAAIAKSM